MFKYRNLKFIKSIGRQYGTKVKQKVTANDIIIDNIEKEMYKPKHHPGIIQIKTVTLPEYVVNAIENVLEDYPVKSLLADSAILARHLKGRVPPMESSQLSETKQKIYERVLKKEGNVEVNNENDEQQLKQRIQDKVIKILKEKVYHWTPMDYNLYNSLQYLLGRSAPEYAVLVKIFSEINTRDPDFKPKSIFDFGSGVGTVTWAANIYWKKYIFEYFNVDASVIMNDLAQLLLQGGRGTKKMDLKGVFYRQFLPASNTSYDLVVSAFSLLELPSFKIRMETILTLWNKTEKYLVIIENGTNGGFKVVNEVRDFILQLEDSHNKGHVYSPCPHDRICPRFILDYTPCNFEVKYATLPIGAKSEVKKELYSYVVLKKGEIEGEDREWPRVVRETLVRSKHTICRICTSQGKLDEVIFTASKYGKTTYHCARATKWGDRLPVTLNETKDNGG